MVETLQVSRHEQSRVGGPVPPHFGALLVLASLFGSAPALAQYPDCAATTNGCLFYSPEYSVRWPDSVLTECANIITGVMTREATGQWSRMRRPGDDEDWSCVVQPDQAEECDLAVANSDISYWVRLDSFDRSDGSLTLYIDVMGSPVLATVYADGRDVDPEDGAQVREACEGFARGFLARTGALQGTTAAPTSAGATQTTPSGASVTPLPAAQVGMLEVLDVSPSPVSVWVDGEEVGVSGGQILVPSGTHQVLLRAPGHRPYETTVEIEADGVEPLRGISLEPLPAALVVRSTVAGATVRIDGRDVGDPTPLCRTPPL